MAFVDTTIGLFNLGQFTDDKNLSRLRTLTAHHPPAEVLYERGGLSAATLAFLSGSLPGVRREGLRPGSEFWEAGKTLKFLAEGEYFRAEAGEKVEWPEALAGLLDPADSLGLTAGGQGDMAVRALGALVWYLQQGLFFFASLTFVTSLTFFLLSNLLLIWLQCCGSMKYLVPYGSGSADS